MGKASKAKAERRVQAERARQLLDGRPLFHGGVRGLSVGSLLIPGDQNDALKEMNSKLPQAIVNMSEYDRVFVTPEIDLARDFASLAAGWPDERLKGGTVYRVRPFGPLSFDRDFPEGISFGVQSAEILEVVEVGLAHHPVSLTGYSLQFSTWDDGSPMYDRELYGIPSQRAQRTLGLTADDFRALGPKPGHVDMVRFGQTIVSTRGVQPELSVFTQAFRV